MENIRHERICEVERKLGEVVSLMIVQRQRLLDLLGGELGDVVSI